MFPLDALLGELPSRRWLNMNKEVVNDRITPPIKYKERLEQDSQRPGDRHGQEYTAAHAPKTEPNQQRTLREESLMVASEERGK